MSGLGDEAIVEGHDLIDAAEHEAQADPADFKKVHRVGETGGSILPDNKASASAQAPAPASSSSSTEQPFGTNGSVSGTLEARLAELRDKLNIKK